MQIRDRLRRLPKEGVLDVFRALNGGTVGFDHERTKKMACIDRLLENHGPFVEEALPEIEARHSAAMAANDASDANDDPAQAAVNALQALARSSINEAKVQRMIEAALEAFQPPSGPHFTVTVNDRETVKVDGHAHPLLPKALRKLTATGKLMLIGPAGCGKSHLAEQLATCLQVQFASVSCTAGMSESNLKGWLCPTGEGGSFEYLPSDFVRCFEEGGLFLWDEADAMDPNVALLTNQALANGKLYLPQRKGASLVKRHPQFYAMAATNTACQGGSSAYAGRERQDEAFIDRFRASRLVMDYDTAFEQTMCPPELVTWAWHVRNRINELRLTSRVMSTRFMLDGAALIAAGEPLDEVQESFFIGWNADERRKVTL